VGNPYLEPGPFPIGAGLFDGKARNGQDFAREKEPESRVLPISPLEDVVLFLHGNSLAIILVHDLHPCLVLERGHPYRCHTTAVPE